MGRKSREKAQRRHEAERLKAAKASEGAQGAGPPGSPTTSRSMPEVEPVLHDGLPVVETADEHLMDALLADRRLAQLLVARLSPTVALVLPENVDRLNAALVKAGHLATVIEQDHVPPPAPAEAAEAETAEPAPRPPRPETMSLPLDL